MIKRPSVCWSRRAGRSMGGLLYQSNESMTFLSRNANVSSFSSKVIFDVQKKTGTGAVASCCGAVIIIQLKAPFSSNPLPLPTL